MQVPLPLSDRVCRCQSGITSQDVPGSLRGTGRADVALEDRPRAGAVAVGVREEGGDGFLGGGRVIIEPARKPEQFSGIVRKLGNGTIMDQAEPTLHGPQEVVGFTQLGMNRGRQNCGSLQGVECLPQVGPQQIGLVGRVDEHQVLDDELQIRQTADSPFQVVAAA